MLYIVMYVFLHRCKKNMYSIPVRIVFVSKALLDGALHCEALRELSGYCRGLNN